jgi:hypothetical protein
MHTVVPNFYESIYLRCKLFFMLRYMQRFTISCMIYTVSRIVLQLMQGIITVMLDLGILEKQLAEFLKVYSFT